MTPADLLELISAILLADRLTNASRRLGDWFTAERGSADGKNGWV